MIFKDKDQTLKVVKLQGQFKTKIEEILFDWKISFNLAGKILSRLFFSNTVNEDQVKISTLSEDRLINIGSNYRQFKSNITDNLIKITDNLLLNHRQFLLVS